MINIIDRSSSDDSYHIEDNSSDNEFKDSDPKLKSNTKLISSLQCNKNHSISSEDKQQSPCKIPQTLENAVLRDANTNKSNFNSSNVSHNQKYAVDMKSMVDQKLYDIEHTIRDKTEKYLGSSENRNILNIKTLLRRIYGYQMTQAIFAFVDMGMADFMFDFEEPIHLKIIKNKFKIDYRAISRLFTFLVTAEVLEFSKNHCYKLSELGRLLSTKSEFSIAGVARLHGSLRTKFYQSWQYLPWSLKNNLPTTMLRNNRSIFSDLIVDPEAFHIFNEGMESLLSIDKSYILKWHDFSQYKTIADIGSGSGGLLKAIMQQNPDVYGIFFHISSIELKKKVTEEDILSRCEFMEGNFLETAPFEADLYILRQVLHHWDEETCHNILSNIHRNMHKNSVLMIIDSLVDEDDPTAKNVLNHRNLHMFVLMDRGRERTDKDYLRICSHLFFFIEKQDLPSELSIIIAIPRGKV